MKEVLVGAKDWRHGSWATSFYPEDLPEDWRLSYYANEYPTTVIDLAGFGPETREDLLEQISDCHDTFHPVLRVNTQQLSFDQVRQFLGGLHEEVSDACRLAGVWLDGEIFDNIEGLQQWREVIDLELPIAVSMDPKLGESVRDRLLADNISQVGHLFETTGAVGHPWLVFVSLDRPIRELAEKIRPLIESDPSSDVMCLIIDEDFSDITKLHEIFTVVQLTGG